MVNTGPRKRMKGALVMGKKDPARLKKVSINLPFGIGGAEWEADPTERRAAWSLYVELVTRVAVQPLGREEGVLREALSSLHSLFGTTRQVLREAGPDVGTSRESLGGIAIAVLNRGLRPFLAKWHPLLQAWENAAAIRKPVCKSMRGNGPKSTLYVLNLISFAKH